MWQMMLGANTRHIETKGNSIRDLIEALNDIACGTLEKEILNEKAT